MKKFIIKLLEKMLQPLADATVDLVRNYPDPNTVHVILMSSMAWDDYLTSKGIYLK